MIVPLSAIFDVQKPLNLLYLIANLAIFHECHNNNFAIEVLY